MSNPIDKLWTIVGTCDAKTCPDRVLAMQLGQFVYSHDAPKGWIFVESSVREWLGAAKWNGGYAQTDHTGEPFTWTTCPWCGRELSGG